MMRGLFFQPLIDLIRATKVNDEQYFTLRLYPGDNESKFDGSAFPPLEMKIEK